MENGEHEEDGNDRDGSDEERDLCRTSHLIAVLHSPGCSGTFSVLDCSLDHMTGEVLVSPSTLFRALRLNPGTPQTI